MSEGHTYFKEFPRNKEVKGINAACDWCAHDHHLYISKTLIAQKVHACPGAKKNFEYLRAKRNTSNAMSDLRVHDFQVNETVKLK